MRTKRICQDARRLKPSSLLGAGIACVPLDEATHAFGDRRLRTEASRRLEIGDICAALSGKLGDDGLR